MCQSPVHWEVPAGPLMCQAGPSPGQPRVSLFSALPPGPWGLPVHTRLLVPALPFFPRPSLPSSSKHHLSAVTQTLIAPISPLFSDANLSFLVCQALF